MMSYIFLVSIAGFCAVKAVRSSRLLHSALWLAGVSVVVTIMLYMIGAYPIAVIELSLSVGLITILLVFAISMVGADSPDVPVSRWFNWPLIVAVLLLLLGLTIPCISPQTNDTHVSFLVSFWQQREADLTAQIALIFSGVLGVLGLLAETNERKTTHQQTLQPTEHGDYCPIKSDEDESEREKV